MLLSQEDVKFEWCAQNSVVLTGPGGALIDINITADPLSPGEGYYFGGFALCFNLPLFSLPVRSIAPLTVPYLRPESDSPRPLNSRRVNAQQGLEIVRTQALD